MPDRDPLLRALLASELNHDYLSAYPNVVGTGVGHREQRGKKTGEITVQVFVSHKYPLTALPFWAQLPPQVQSDERSPSVDVDVIDVGFVHGFQDTTRYRPVPGGCSIGHQSLTDAGTLGGWAGDN